MRFLFLLGLGVSLIGGNCPLYWEQRFPDISFIALRRVRNSLQVPQRYEDIVAQLEDPDSEVRIEAINTLKDIIVNQEKDERIKGILALKVADMLSDPKWPIRQAAVSALSEIIPSLAEEEFKKELALRVADMLSDPDENVRQAAVYALGKIIPSLAEESKEAVALKVADRLSDSDENVRWAAVYALGKIIPSLAEEELKKELALKVADRLSDSEWVVRRTAVSVLEKIIPSLAEESKKAVALKVADMLSDSDENVRRIAVYVLGEIIPSLTEESKKAVALKVADMLSDSDVGVRRTAVYVLGEIIPSLAEEELKKELALRVADMLSDSDEHVRQAAFSVLEKISSSFLLPVLLEKLSTETDFRVAKAYYLIDQVVNYQQLIDNSLRTAHLFGNSLFQGVKTASLLWIYQNISYFLKKEPSQYSEDWEQERAEALQEAVERLENKDLLPEELEEFLKEFAYWIIQEVVGNELKAEENNYPSAGGKLHFTPAGEIKEDMRKAILAILGIEEGAGFFASGKVEYLLPVVHSARNLAYMITALKTMGIIQEESPFQYTIRGRMMDDVKYTAWLMLGLLPEQTFNIKGLGKSAIGPHGLIVHGGGNLDTKPGEEEPQGEEKYDRTDFLFLWTADNFEEVVLAGQYYSSLLQNERALYEEFKKQLEETYAQFSISREEFKRYIELKYEGENRDILLSRIDEIPWEDGKVNMAWIFTARWLNDTPRPSSFGPRYEASWEGMVMQVVLQEAFKYYYEQGYGEGSWAEYLSRRF